MSPKKILVVEDDSSIRTLLVEVLYNEGYLVDEASNGAEAVDYLKNESRDPCVVLLDMLMPKMTGWDLLEILRETDHLLAIPVVVLSASLVDPNIKGARKVIKKPISINALLSIVEELCEKSDSGCAKRAK